MDEPPKKVSADAIGSPATIDSNLGFRKQSAKRRNVTRACDSCRSKKRRCTGDQPCGACRPYGTACTYTASYTRGRIPQTVSSRTQDSGPPYERVASDVGVLGATNRGRTSDPDLQANAISGSARVISPEYDNGEVAGQYLGKGSAHSFLQNAWKRLGTNTSQAQAKQHTDNNEGCSIFAFGDSHVHKVFGEAELPEQRTSLALVSIYFDFAMPTYRFLHEPTITAWLSRIPENAVSATPESLGLSNAQQAIVLLVLASALLYQKEAPQPEIRVLKYAWRESEKLFQAAQRKLDAETGKPSLESVQARLATCLYLNSTSRPSQAWFALGTIMQLITASAYHRRSTASGRIQGRVESECRKRTFWCAHTIDVYFSVIHGRPPLIQDDLVDQDLPDSVNDEDLAGMKDGAISRDSTMMASILHTKLARIVKKASLEQQQVRKSHRLDSLDSLNAELESWRTSLPVMLSGAIHPSSLVQPFERQCVTLSLAYSHAVMLVNRPLLLCASKLSQNKEAYLEACMLAAKSALDSTHTLATSKSMYASFWFSQFVTFNALSLVYVWLIQRKSARLPQISSIDESSLFSHAEVVQSYLAEATHLNAPSLKYSVILQELQAEASRVIGRLASSTQRRDLLTGQETTGTSTVVATVPNELDADFLGADFAFDPDLWQQLDAFPLVDHDYSLNGFDPLPTQ